MIHDELFASDLLRGPEIPTELLRALPKTDLHVHLDGSLRFDSYVELCRAQGKPLTGGTPQEARRLFFTHRPSHTLTDYLELFDSTIAVLQAPDALRRVACEIAEDCAAENVWHMELRFSPILHGQEGLSLDQATDAVLAGLADARQKTGISTGVLITGIRHRSPEDTLKLAEVAVRYKGRGVTGFDLAGAELDNPAKLHRDAFALILNHNINCTVHAGEAFGPASIHQALHYLGAHRIGHGTRLLEDPELLGYVADHRIPLEVCLTSSLRTGTVPDIESHPLRRFMRAGLRATLNTANRMFLQTTLTDELRLAADTFDLTLVEIENLLVAGFKSAFLPQRERVAMLRRAIDRFIAVRYETGLEPTT
jgi:adenosine deaminase